MLGSFLSKHLVNSEIIFGRKHVDLTDLQKTKQWLNNKKFSTIIHTAAFTDLDFCEKNEEMSFVLHSSIIEVFRKHCSKIVYISTVPVWDEKHYKKNVYFESKKSGEQKVLNCENGLVIRTNIYGDGGLVKWAVNNISNKQKINGFSDVYFNPIHVAQLTDFIVQIIQKDKCESLYTVASDQILTKFDFLKKVSKTLNLDSSLINPVISNKSNLILKNIDITFSLEEGIRKLKNDYKN